MDDPHRRSALRALCRVSVGLHPHRKPGLCYRQQRLIGNRCLPTLDLTGLDHDWLSATSTAGKNDWYFLDHFQVSGFHLHKRCWIAHPFISLGGFLGSMISFGLNFNSSSGTVSDGTYIAFMCIMAVGCSCALGLLKPYNVIREDNSRAAVDRKPRVWDEFKATLRVVKDWRVVSLIPFWITANCEAMNS